MKYFVFSYLWKLKGEAHWNSATGLYKGTVVGLFEMGVQQKETWCLITVAEISKTDYVLAEKRGIIG